MLNIAHRGASAEFPENTLCAFEAAIAAGAATCELDVRQTADGALVVIHDDTVDRTTSGHGLVAAMAVAELRQLDAGQWRGARFSGERIPTLREVFELTRGRCGLNIELKAAGIAGPICDLIREYGAEQSTLLSSFDWQSIAELRRVAPELQTGLLASRGAANLLDAAAALKVTTIHPRHELVDLRLSTAAHQRNLKIYAWTVDDTAEMVRLIEASVDGIITNYPGRLRTVLAARTRTNKGDG